MGDPSEKSPEAGPFAVVVTSPRPSANAIKISDGSWPPVAVTLSNGFQDCQPSGEQAGFSSDIRLVIDSPIDEPAPTSYCWACTCCGAGGNAQTVSAQVKTTGDVP